MHIVSLLFLLLVFSGPAQASGLSFVIPPENTRVEAEIVTVVLTRGGSDLDELRLEVNGRKQPLLQKVLDRHYLCYAGVKLDFGRNVLKVQGLKNGKVVEEVSRQMYYWSELSGKNSAASAGSTPYLFHDSSSAKTCTPCHTLQWGAKTVKGGTPEQSPCFLCHRKTLSSYRFVHGPAAVWDCLACHDPKRGAGKGGKLIKGTEQLCIRCHETGWNSRRFGHGPTAAGNCTTCHNPHASDDPSFLRLPSGQICAACHEEVLSRPHVLSGFANAGHPVEGNRDPLNQKGKFTCVSCHDPHAEESPQFLKGYDPDRSMQQYCKRCHRM